MIIMKVMYLARLRQDYGAAVSFLNSVSNGDWSGREACQPLAGFECAGGAQACHLFAQEMAFGDKLVC